MEGPCSVLHVAGVTLGGAKSSIRVLLLCQRVQVGRTWGSELLCQRLAGQYFDRCAAGLVNGIEQYRRNSSSHGLERGGHFGAALHRQCRRDTLLCKATVRPYLRLQPSQTQCIARKYCTGKPENKSTAQPVHECSGCAA